MASDLFEEDISYEHAVDPRHAPRSIESLFNEALGGQARSRIARAREASRAWKEANGDRERAHTTGVTLLPARPPATDPRMVVYVDSNVLLSDFRTNTDLYLGRLANWGLALSGLDFRLSKDNNRRWHSSSASTVSAISLTPEQESWLDELVTDLPEDSNLRAKARSAAASSLRRNL